MMTTDAKVNSVLYIYKLASGSKTRNGFCDVPIAFHLYFLHTTLTFN